MVNQQIDLLLIGAELIAVTDNYQARLNQLRREHKNLVLNLQGAPVTCIKGLRSQISHLNELEIQAHHIYQRYLYCKRIQVEALGFQWPSQSTQLNTTLNSTILSTPSQSLSMAC